ncbi:hypothetical protein [Hyphobacterium sp.]|uniref:hypothetical protein n=1 Tax=Hyphobacterium sp. TaxID=2004662 RepID=UPI0037497F45
MDSFGEIFSSFWWLLFPLAFFLIAGWNSFMSYKRTKAKIELLKTYAAAGKEAPADLVASLNSETDRHGGREWHDNDGDGDSGGGSGVFLVVLFSGLSAIFAFAGYSGWLGDETSMYFVSMILGVLALAFLASSLFGKRRKR